MNKFSRIFLAIVLLFSLPLAAQLKKTFLKGTLTLADGSKKEGFVQLQDIATMNKGVEFKESLETAAFTHYDTTQVLGLKTEDGDVFERIKVQLYDPFTEITTIAKVLSNGKASLYKIQVGLDMLYIVKTNDKQFVLQDDKINAGQGAAEATTFNFRNVMFAALAGGGITEEQAERLTFSESQFMNLVSKYNKAMGQESTVKAIKPKNVSFVIPSAGFMTYGGKTEYYGRLNFRLFTPKISTGTSFNTGIHFIQQKFTSTYTYATSQYDVRYVKTVKSIPVYIQQNLLSGAFRPYIFCGLNFSIVTLDTDSDSFLVTSGLQTNRGIGFVGGAGLEVTVVKGLMVRAEFLHENYTHLVMGGIAYIIPVKK
jgi:hypothetical protein